MYVVPNASASDEGVMAALQEVKTGFVAATESRIRFSFMRLDASAEPAMIKSLNLVDAAPKLVVMNAGKRKRFLHHDGDMNAKDLQSTLEKILNGEGRFKTVKGNKLPPLESAQPEPEKKEDL